MRARTLTALLAPALLLLGLTWVATPASAGEAKVEICHFPPGNPDNFHTILISQSALPAHLAHGDVGDTCDAHCENLCDDGNACTIDSCDAAGGCAAPEPADCNDGDLCTTDSCDPVTGCGNECVDCPAPDLCTISTCAADTGECVDTPVVCPDGETCNLDTGTCGLPGPPLLCPCEDTWNDGEGAIALNTADLTTAICEISLEPDNSLGAILTADGGNIYFWAGRLGEVCSDGSLSGLIDEDFIISDPAEVLVCAALFEAQGCVVQPSD